jgi:hypothetical protein
MNLCKFCFQPFHNNTLFLGLECLVFCHSHQLNYVFNQGLLRLHQFLLQSLDGSILLKELSCLHLSINLFCSYYIFMCLLSRCFLILGYYLFYYYFFRVCLYPYRISTDCFFRKRVSSLYSSPFFIISFVGFICLF